MKAQKTATKNNETKYLFIILLSLLLLVFLGVILYYDYRLKEKIPQEFFQVSQPVYKLTGEITAVSASTITVLMNNHSLTPTPGKQIKLTFTLDKNTSITTSALSVPFHVRTDVPRLPQLTIRNLEKGQLVEVVSKDDLRTAKSWDLSTSQITILNVTNMLHGIITSREKNTLSIRGTPVLNPSAISYLSQVNEENYTVLLESDTEISYKPPVPPPTDPSLPPPESKPIIYTAQDLVPNTEVTVYISGNVTSQKPLQAHMIIPYITRVK